MSDNSVKIKIMRLEEWLRIRRNIPNLIVFPIPQDAVLRKDMKQG